MNVDLRPTTDEVENQGQVGSCTAEAGSKAVEVLYERMGIVLNLSPMYLYYWDRADNNAIGQEGSDPNWMLKGLQKRGTCLESSWPYNPANENVQPPANCDIEAAQYKIIDYRCLPQTFDRVSWVKACLMAGSPVMMAFCVTNAFMSQAGACNDWRKTSWVDDAIVGGHEVLIIGFDDAAGRVLVQNSWGSGWADGGFFGMTYDYLNKNSSTLFAVTKAQVPFVPSPAYTENSNAKVYLGPHEDFTAANSGLYIYGGGGSGLELHQGVKEVTFDSNIDRLPLPLPSVAYTFAQTGNMINIYDVLGTTLLVHGAIATIASIHFTDGTATVELSHVTGEMHIGEQLITAVPSYPYPIKLG